MDHESAFPNEEGEGVARLQNLKSFGNGSFPVVVTTKTCASPAVKLMLMCMILILSVMLTASRL